MIKRLSTVAAAAKTCPGEWSAEEESAEEMVEEDVAEDVAEDVEEDVCGKARAGVEME